ncbi:hypothetical protein M0R72_04335 [Candidatus Pacearchaeota archaeon]|jgi:hypothetical protein|nr:hypothetical protein [Candidatus Pacearchaeota archaeon]
MNSKIKVGISILLIIFFIISFGSGVLGHEYSFVHKFSSYIALILMIIHVVGYHKIIFNFMKGGKKYGN